MLTEKQEAALEFAMEQYNQNDEFTFKSDVEDRRIAKDDIMCELLESDEVSDLVELIVHGDDPLKEALISMSIKNKYYSILKGKMEEAAKDFY